MSLGYPDEILVTCDVLAKEAHHAFVESVLNVHISASVDSRDLLKVSA